MLLARIPTSAKIMVAQPRRLAAWALYQRALSSGELPKRLIGLRMGHGVREESPGTRLWYVTSGYLARLAGHASHALSSVSHLIIDECHERSVDSDLVSLFARRLLQQQPQLRVVLMSATMDSSLYTEYFTDAVGAAAVAEPLYVGERRFPLRELFLEELEADELLPSRLRSQVRRLAQRCESVMANGRVPQELTASQLELAGWCTRLVAQRRLQGGGGGLSVLIFVSGMAEVEELSEVFGSSDMYFFLPIHSDIPFEEQLPALEAAPAGVVRVIAATNAAESSLTLPDVDVVICLGTRKQIFYSQHRRAEQLLRTWVSRASAQQRAGRTARLRPGTVYRLYPRSVYEGLRRYDEPEMARKPLEGTLLQLRAALPASQRLSTLLRDLMEPPPAAAARAAMRTLHEFGMIEVAVGDLAAAADDDDDDDDADDFERQLDVARLTPLGQLASALKLELGAARLLSFGIALGCTAEALVMCAAHMLPHPPFRTPL